MNEKQYQAKLVNQAFKDATEEIHRLNTELSAMQTFLAAYLATQPEHKSVITKAMIDHLHEHNLAEISVTSMPDKSFILEVVVPKEEEETKLIIEP